MRVFLISIVVLGVGAAGAADEVRLTSGEVLSGTITEATGSRVLFRAEGGPVRAYHKRQLVSAVDAGGETVALEIELSKEPLSVADRTLLRQVGTVEQIFADPRVMALLDDCSVAAVEELTALATDPASKSRAAALWMLGLVGAPEAVRTLVRVATGDANAKIRFAAANQLMAPHVVRCVESEGLLDAVKTGLEDKSRNNRFCFAFVAGKLGDEDAVPVLKTHLKNSDHHFRESAALLLAELGNDTGVPTLLKMLRAKGDEEQKIPVCSALGALKSKAALPALRKLAKSKHAGLAAAAAKAIQATE